MPAAPSEAMRCHFDWGNAVADGFAADAAAQTEALLACLNPTKLPPPWLGLRNVDMSLCSTDVWLHFSQCQENDAKHTAVSTAIHLYIFADAATWP
eukprot:CAMPEP_0172884150 /NCGR_PEP_ID=MMETSP1075-20121228/124435_1 /TAXON_ID=2916 /ORGANISM="Ceratium fusus, Strain PA161109" /LENGTH=95 /DNA_ID=CAMNT_0013737191 /DNA_START=343 /DNA_END=627 /DNA_ORIENTATION=+